MNWQTGGRAVLVLLGVVIIASVSVGGWTWWTRAQFAATEISHVKQVAVEGVQPVTAAPIVESPMRIVEPKPEVAAATVKANPISADIVIKKEMPKGAKHLKQDELLAAMARQMHDEAFHRFINQPGAGVRRLVPTIRALPREWMIPEWTSEEISKEQPPQEGIKDLSLIHRLSLNRFSTSNAQGPKLNAAEKPQRTEQLWEIHALDLVGLVIHETPKVYVSKRLPEMKELKNTPIRDLDVFESEGLEELVNGKDLYVRSKEGTLRVLGPIRAGQACLKCHGDTKEGDMLGAFSYTLRIGTYQQTYQGKPIPARSFPRDVP
jgi:hypothetical protein